MRRELPIERLRGVCAGAVLARGEPAFDEACRGYNRHVSWSPEAIVCALGTGDVAQAIGFARAQGLTVAVRSGGTGTVGAPPGSLLIDLADLDAVDVQPASVRVGAGATWASIDRQCAAFGRFAPGAQTPWVGAGGFVLGGGFGWMGRRRGWAADNLLELELVDADGRVVHVSPQSEPELLWGMRGSGWNFGVVTSLTLRTFPCARVLAGDVAWGGAELAEVLAFWERWTDTVPDELTSDLAVLPGLPGAPPPLGGSLVRVAFCACEQTPEALDAVARLRAFGAPLADTTAERDYLELQDQPRAFLMPGLSMRFRMTYLDELGEDAIAATVAAARELPPLGFVDVHHYRGALGRVGEDASAMSHRGAKLNYMVATRWQPPEDPRGGLAWQDALLDAVRGARRDRAYVNYLFDEPQRVARAYAPQTLARLERLKRRWDPGNLFRHNHNVAPAASADAGRSAGEPA